MRAENRVIKQEEGIKRTEITRNKNEERKKKKI